MGLSAARLRHRLRIERPAIAQAPDSGTLTSQWEAVATVHAAIEPLSVKDFIAAGAQKSAVSARIVIRWRAGLTHDMRLVATDGTIYTPAGFLADPESGREYLTIPAKVTA